MMKVMPLAVALILLMIDSAIELAFISSMVGYLHRSGANQYQFEYHNTSATVNAKPAGLLVDQGHTSNGAAGTALVLICFGGFTVLWTQRQRERRDTSGKPSRIFLAYTVFAIISALFTLTALVYTFTVTSQTKGQTINQTLAFQDQGQAYPQDSWTPETWTEAVLALPVTSDEDANYLRHWLRVMEGWKWNLIPMFILGLVVASLSIKTHMQSVKEHRVNRQQYKRMATNMPSPVFDHRAKDVHDQALLLT